MLAAPEATDWAAHPAARTGKLEKRGRLKDEWKARHFELRGCYLVCFADAKPGRPALAVFDVTKVACARDANDPTEIMTARGFERPQSFEEAAQAQPSISEWSCCKEGCATLEGFASHETVEHDATSSFEKRRRETAPELSRTCVAFARAAWKGRKCFHVGALTCVGFAREW